MNGRIDRFASTNGGRVGEAKRASARAAASSIVGESDLVVVVVATWPRSVDSSMSSKNFR